MNRGVLYAASAYLYWGLFPLYFRQVANVPPVEMVMHRTVGAMVFLLGVLLLPVSSTVDIYRNKRLRLLYHN